MKRLGYLLICFVFIGISCTKTTQVHFHGRVLLSCSGQLPVKNCKVTITREYDTGSDQYESVGETMTNNDGYYELIADVKLKKVFKDYRVDFAAPQYPGDARSYNDGQDVEINGTLRTSEIYKFHIKNVSPFNSSDELMFLKLTDHNPPFNIITQVNYLTGNVDTIIYKVFIDQPKMDYSYSYTKNAVNTTVPADTLARPNCLDTVSVNVFY